MCNKEYSNLSVALLSRNSFCSTVITTTPASAVSAVKTGGTGSSPTIQVRILYDRTFYTTDTNVTITNLGISQEYLFGNGNLTNGSITTGPLMHPITSDYYGYFDPFYFAAGYDNIINFDKINFNTVLVDIDVDIFMIYEGNMPGDDD